MKIEDFGELQTRYQAMRLSARATAVLADAAPALEAAERNLVAMSGQKDVNTAFDKLRKNSLLLGKMRASEARNLLLDTSVDFIKETRRKLATWRKTMERVAQGEGIVSEKHREYIPGDQPLALAIIGSAGISNYISIAQLALMELAKIDSGNAAQYSQMVSEIRRCATVLSDYENASGIHTVIH